LIRFDYKKISVSGFNVRIILKKLCFYWKNPKIVSNGWLNFSLEIDKCSRIAYQRMPIYISRRGRTSSGARRKKPVGIFSTEQRSSKNGSCSNLLCSKPTWWTRSASKTPLCSKNLLGRMMLTCYDSCWPLAAISKRPKKPWLTI
jgi:hypothetical protein